MVLRTFLLVSDDPDDQLEFSEALYEVSSDTILINVAHAEKAMAFLDKKVCLPEYIILDLSVNGVDPNEFLTKLEKDPLLQRIPVIAYGDYSDFDKIKSNGISAFLNRDSSYSDLRVFLTRIVKQA
jgi:CheY-like chemotaxis protein